MILEFRLFKDCASEYSIIPFYKLGTTKSFRVQVFLESSLLEFSKTREFILMFLLLGHHY
jgi:hypothetical protein